MSDYVVTTDFSIKDGLTTGDANKLIKGSDFDTEFDNIATAVATKYDSNDIASQAQAEGETANTVLVTPLRLANWADYNAGMIGDIQALADPNADQLLGWDDSAGAAIGFTMGTGLAFSTTTIALSHLGIESLTDPDADRILFWDDGAGGSAWLTAGNGIEISGTNLQITDAAAATGNPIDVTSGAFSIDLTALAQVDGTDIVGADEFLVDDGGTPKALRWQDFGIPQTDDSTVTPMSAADLTYANRWYNCNNASAVSFVIPANASVAYPVGTVFAVHQRGAGQVTVSVTTDTLRSPNGAKTSQQYSTIFVTKVASAEWVVTGDSTT